MTGFSDKRLFIRLFFLASCALTFINTSAQQTPLSNPADLQVLDYYNSRANDFAAKNLNRFAVDRLHAYDFMLDSLYRKEKRDTLASIESNYRSRSRNTISSITTYKSGISTLTTEKTSKEHLYWSMIRKAVVSFIVWMVIVLLLLQYRKRKLKLAQNNLALASKQMENMQQLSVKTEKFKSEFSDKKEVLKTVSNDANTLNDLLLGLPEGIKTSEKGKSVLSKAGLLKKLSQTESAVINAVYSQSEKFDDDKVNVDLNVLCEQYLEMASRGIPRTETFTISITRDFEKNLPSVKVNPSAVGTLILNVLTNAIQSVKEKSEKQIKGYQPKISVSTRILPRFVQIRIKDNGTGMKDEVLKKATEEFYSTRSLGEGAGLGLYESKTIISEMHKGEIKIETEEGTSTDVYLKFFT